MLSAKANMSAKYAEFFAKHMEERKGVSDTTQESEPVVRRKRQWTAGGAIFHDWWGMWAAYGSVVKPVEKVADKEEWLYHDEVTQSHKEWIHGHPIIKQSRETVKNKTGKNGSVWSGGKWQPKFKAKDSQSGYAINGIG